MKSVAKQKITLSIEKTLLQLARGVAAQRGLSISAYLAEELDRASLRDEEYQRAMASAIAHMKSAQLRGGRGFVDRAELHDRKGLR